MITLKPLPTIANVIAGGDISITLPVGNIYESVHLYYEGVTPKQLENIKTVLNTRTVSEWKDGERLNSIDKHYNRELLSGVLIFNFNRPELQSLSDGRFFGLDTSASQGISVAAIKMRINDKAAAPKLKAFGKLAQTVEGVPNFLTKVRHFNIPVAQIGQFDIDSIPRPNGASIAAIHLFMPMDDGNGGTKCAISSADILVDNVNWHDLDAKEAANFQSVARHKRNPQTNESAVIDLILDGDINHALALNGNIQDFRLRCVADAVGQCEVAIEYVDMWGAGRF